MPGDAEGRLSEPGLRALQETDKWLVLQSTAKTIWIENRRGYKLLGF